MTRIGIAAMNGIPEPCRGVVRYALQGAIPWRPPRRSLPPPRLRPISSPFSLPGQSPCARRSDAQADATVQVAVEPGDDMLGPGPVPLDPVPQAHREERVEI